MQMTAIYIALSSSEIYHEALSYQWLTTSAVYDKEFLNTFETYMNIKRLIEIGVLMS